MLCRADTLRSSTVHPAAHGGARRPAHARGVTYGVPIEPMAIAHRGGAALAPENTLAAFGLATSLGLRYLETDVRVTRDGALVCFHDPTLDRVTDGRGRVRRHSLATLRTLRVAGTELIPTLAEALDAFPDSNFTVDLKEEDAIEPLARLLRHRNVASRVCVAGAWDGSLARLRGLVPHVRTALGWRSLTALVWYSRTAAALPDRIATAPFAHVPVRLGALPIVAERLVAGAHGIGVRVVVWTVDDPDQMHRLLDTGVDGIITDRPDVLREVMIARGSWSPMDRHRHARP
jgi:glycerophosphoryl diester phosphodiesterase